MFLTLAFWLVYGLSKSVSTKALDLDSIPPSEMFYENGLMKGSLESLCQDT